MGDDPGPVIVMVILFAILGNLMFTIVLVQLLSERHVPQLVRPRCRPPARCGSIIAVTTVELERIAYMDAGILRKSLAPFLEELMAGIIVKVRLSEPHSVFFGAPARHKQASLLAISAVLAIFAISMKLGSIKMNPREDHDMFFFVVFAWSCVLVCAWAAPILAMHWHALETGVFMEMQLNPHQLRYSQDSIASHFHDGVPVWERLGNYSVCACMKTTGYDDDGHAEEELFTLNNRTLYSAIYNGVNTISVIVVDTDDWEHRFTAQCPWTTIRVREPRRALPLQAGARPEALHVNTPKARGHVVLEVDHIINRRPGQEETLCTLLRTRLVHLANQIEQEDGPRSYARVRVPMEQEDVVRAEIKQIGHEHRKRVNIKTISRVFESPRD